jgi:hypothetical protein
MAFGMFVFGDTLEKAIELIPESEQLRYYRYIKDYGLHGIEPDLSGFEAATWIQMKTLIDNTMPEKGNYRTGKNGAPFGNSNASKNKNQPNQPENNQNNQNQPNQPETTPLMGMDNVNVNENVNEKEFTEKPPESLSEQSFSTANAVAPSETALVPKQNKPPGRKKQELAPAQLELYHAARVCFESSEKAKAMMYQDEASTKRELNHLKTFAVRCSNMAPGMEPEFLKTVLEHFKLMCNGKLHGKVAFTPQNLITPWVWSLVIDSLPVQSEITSELQKTIRNLFQ